MIFNRVYSEKTNYRTVIKGELFYLQFNEIVEFRNFPDFWNKKTIEIWKFVPGNNQYLHSYISKESCPTDLLNFVYDESELMVHGTEEEIKSFIKEFPDIEKHFDKQNFKRALYMDHKEKIKNLKEQVQ